MKRISVFITVPQYQAILAMAHARGLTFAELLRRAIEQFLKSEKAS